MDHFYQNIHGWCTEKDQLMLLKKILPECTHVTIAELGVWRGRQTAMWVVHLLNNNYTFDYHAIDWFSETRNIGFGTTSYELVKKNLAPIIDRINLVKSETSIASSRFPDKYFDIVYVDAGHEYVYVKGDIDNWLPKVKTGGWICGDDYINKWPDVIKAVNESFGVGLCFIGNQQWAYQKVVC